MERSLRLEGHISAEEVRRSPYLYLPVPVPPRASRLHVAYEYSDPVTARRHRDRQPDQYGVDDVLP